MNDRRWMQPRLDSIPVRYWTAVQKPRLPFIAIVREAVIVLRTMCIKGARIEWDSIWELKRRVSRLCHWQDSVAARLSTGDAVMPAELMRETRKLRDLIGYAISSRVIDATFGLIRELTTIRRNIAKDRMLVMDTATVNTDGRSRIMLHCNSSSYCKIFDGQSWQGLLHRAWRTFMPRYVCLRGYTVFEWHLRMSNR